MRRRGFLGVLGSAAAAFRDTLRELDWVDGSKARIENRIGNTVQVTSANAAELIALNPDIIVTTGAPILAALHRQTKIIPIVFTLVTYPVADGFVQERSRF